MAPPVPPQPPELPLVVRVYCAQSPTIAASAWAFLPRFEHRSFLPARSCRRSAITCRRGYDWQRTRQMALPFPITLPTDYWYSSARERLLSRHRYRPTVSDPVPYDRLRYLAPP